MDQERILNLIKKQALAGDFRLTQHAQQEMAEREIELSEILEAIETAQVLEHYPEHRRGACCLIGGRTMRGRYIHIVCTTSAPRLIIVTAYEPELPKWITPTQRRLR